MPGPFHVAMGVYAWALVSYILTPTTMHALTWIGLYVMYRSWLTNSRMPAQLNIIPGCFPRKGHLNVSLVMVCYWPVMQVVTAQPWWERAFALPSTLGRWPVQLPLKLSKPGTLPQ